MSVDIDEATRALRAATERTPPDSELAETLGKARKRGRQRQQRRLTGVAFAALTAFALGTTLRPREAAMEHADAAERTTHVLESGTRIIADDETEYEVRHTSGGAVRVQLHRGQARFEVAPSPDGFFVHTGVLEVRVIGTVFEVQAGTHPVVRVQEGRVEVRYGKTLRELGPGERFVARPSAPARSEPHRPAPAGEADAEHASLIPRPRAPHRPSNKSTPSVV
ncbi:MAG: FecR family protein, partial [Myxococcota bacterium]